MPSSGLSRWNKFQWVFALASSAVAWRRAGDSLAPATGSPALSEGTRLFSSGIIRRRICISIIRRRLVGRPRGIIRSPRPIIRPSRSRVPCAWAITIIGRPTRIGRPVRWTWRGHRLRPQPQRLSVDAPHRCRLRWQDRTGHFQRGAAGGIRIVKPG